MANKDHHGPIWSNFMRNDIGKKLCHFFMVNHSTLLALILHEIACFLFLLSKLELSIDYIMKNTPRLFLKNCKRHFWPIISSLNFNVY